MEFLKKIDKIYVINLESRIDRKVKWETKNDNLKMLQNKVQIFQAIDGNLHLSGIKSSLRPGEIGCSMSHICVWQDALKCGYNQILVFEDDVILDKKFEEKLNDVLMCLKGEFDWLYLYNTWDYRPVEFFSDKLQKVIASLGTQAYIINTKSVSRLLPFVQEFVFPIDVVMGHMSFLSKVYRPTNIFVQHDENSPSDTKIANQQKKFFTKIIVKLKELFNLF
jgi:GR25 family glycosyltransferase involved in LPS biosynthesis